MKNGCVVGVGAIGPVHASALMSIDSLYAVCDNQPDRLADFYPNNSELHRYNSFDDVLNDSRVQVVHICTPHYLHKDMAVAAMEHNKAVVLEKPAAMNERELDELCAAQKRLNGKICVMLQNRTNPGIVELKRRIAADKELGRLQEITGIVTWNRDAEYYNHDAWRGKWKTEGGGLLINQAIHTIDLMCWLGGGIKFVRGSISNKTLEGIIEVEDTADAIFKTCSGMSMCFYATNGCGISRPAQLEVQFEFGKLRYADNRLYRITESSCETVVCDSGDVPGKSCWGSGHKRVITDFYKYLETGSGEYINLYDAVPAMKAMYAFYKSAERNKEVQA